MRLLLSTLVYQVAKLPQIVQQQPTVTSIQQIVSSPQQVCIFRPSFLLFNYIISLTFLARAFFTLGFKITTVLAFREMHHLNVASFLV